MSKGLSSQTKRELANKLIIWLGQTYAPNNQQWPNLPSWPNTSKMLDDASEALNAHKYDLWQVHDLLRALGRVELNNPNGRKGGHLANNTPVELPLITERKCSPDRCPIVKAVLKTFPNIKKCDGVCF